jgi:probable HAF family extracellular repeat protein
LGTLDRQGATFAYGINASGQVVGTTWIGVQQHAFLWTAGALQDLGLLPGTFECFAAAINDNGQVVGFCNTGFHQTAAFLWAADTAMTELPFPNQSAPLIFKQPVRVYMLTFNTFDL